MDIGVIIIVIAFLVYYFAVLIFEKRMISEPTEILDKFFAVTMLYVGISIIYFSLTGKPFLTDTIESYSIYIFLIGLVALLWTIPDLLNDFRVFKKLFRKKK